MPRSDVLTPHQRLVLERLQRQPDLHTDELAISLGLSVPHVRTVLLSLLRRKLVGRQESLLPHEYISTWRVTWRGEELAKGG